MTTNKQLIAIAQKYIGQGGARFRKFAGLPAGASYCNAYVDYIADEGGVAKLYFDGRKETYCPNSIKWCRKNLALVPLYLALPADIIYFDWDGNGVPNHIGFVREHKSTSEIRTIEGNTNGGVVARKTRTSKYIQGVFRVHLRPSGYTLGKLKIDGSFGYSSIANLQRALHIDIDGVLGKGTVKALQKRAGVKQDGAWGTKTSKAVQKLTGTKQDGAFGSQSVKALQKWINKQNKTPTPAPEPTPDPEPTPEPTPAPQTNADKIVAKIDEYAYAYKTSKSKWSYSKGKPKLAYKDAIKKYMKKTAKISQSDCGYFVSTCIRAAGISKSFLALRGRKQSFPAVPSSMKVVHKGKKIPSGLLKPGDVIRYKKKGGGQHTLMFYGNGKIAEAGRGHYFPAIKKDTKKYNKSNVKKSTIQVLRAR